MLTINKLLPRGRGLSGVLLKRAATVELDWDVRQKSRFDATDSQGRAIGVFLPRGTVVRGGDALVAEDGSLVVVKAAPQPVLVVRACAAHGSAFDLMRAAYHLGNRHVQLELQPDRLLLEPDHVLADMLRQMHLEVAEERCAFEPEGGAYAAAGHGHAHHGHARAPDQGHTAHVHGPGCSHDHGPAHEHGPGCGHAHGTAAPAATAAPASTSAATPAAAPRGKPLGIAVSAAPAPHVHGPHCSHGHDH